MSRTTLKSFQEAVVDNVSALLGACLRDLESLRGSEGYAASRRAVLGDRGSVLIEAPTGIGKTLMAAHAVGRLCEAHSMLWLWFAPFQSVVVQTQGTLLDEVGCLRPRDPHKDRAIEELEPGDVLISTWASVAVSDTEMRKIRRASELAPSLDELIGAARARGWLVGAVIDEAHHSFRGATRAYEFFRDVVDPDATILITATPRDSDIEQFKDSVHLGNLRRVRVPRSEGVEGGLLKAGIKTAVFKAPANVDELLDFKRTALSQAVAVHRRLKQILHQAGAGMTPLLLVQVGEDSGPKLKAEDEARKWLEELGFPKSAIMVHTAKEPDPSLNSVQGDEEVEVLVFKMAVAMGFDAPRAFCLASFRTSRDPDFGLQIVGRLMRVDRRLQGRRDLPSELSNGYVFLSDRDAQTGILSAGDRINGIKGELASLETSVSVAIVGSGGAALVEVEGSQPGLFSQPIPPSSSDANGEGNAGDLSDRGPALYDRVSLWDSLGISSPGAAAPAPQGTREKSPPLRYGKPSVDRGEAPRRYEIAAEAAYPKYFTRAEIDVLDRDVLGEVVDRFRWDDQVFTLAMTDSQRILMEELEIFSGLVDAPTEIRAKLMKDEIARRAQYALVDADRDGFLDRRRLYDALVERLREESDRRGLSGFETREQLETALARILALRPSLLTDAVEESFAKHTVTRASASLPSFLESQEALMGARKNLYGAYPPDLNAWERPFAELLDTDTTGLVRWWHRNPVRKPWSITLPVPGHGFFYPDIAAGIEGRDTPGGIVLVEIKHQINDPEGNAAAKARAKHPDYGSVLMLYYDEGNDRWMTVVYDTSSGKNELDRVFRLEYLRVV
jgi:type III restriction enzyme